MTDDFNLSSSCTTSVEIVGHCDCPPVCDGGGPYEGLAGDPIQFDGTRSSAIPCFSIVFYEWSFGDGGTAIGPVPMHTYAAPGVYDVGLTVWDDDGWVSICHTTASVLVSEVQPTTWGAIKSQFQNEVLTAR